jgi:alanyl-tRNA synthetase
MDSGSIRQTFLDFFRRKGHTIVASAPLVLKNDPTLLFTNSGMVQFKDNFLGNEAPKSPRIADTQKCLRVSGKHNDLEEVGIDTYHHTMFEMLGNWSFGDYFKKEAIEWAWELLTVEYRLPKDRLYVTVFGGDKDENLPVDEEAYNHWKKIVEPSKILYGIKKDNFWEMGETGPCGPCSEIHIDLRSEEEISKLPGAKLVNESHPHVIEIWNLVFMEFNRKADGSLEKLPAQHVDTGMGFERLCMAIQKKTSNYDTDVFSPLIDFIGETAGIKYKSEERTDIAMRVIADHVRAVAFAIADGQLPSNTGAGYVIRRILRRGVRYGFTFLDFKAPFIHRLVPILSNQLKNVFPELETQKDYVSKVIFEEEASFLRTLEKGLKRIDNIHAELTANVISGAQAFELYDTYGFPLDLTSLIARERGISVDEKGFASEMEKQKTRSKVDAAKETGDWILVAPEVKPRFVGYDQLEAEVNIVKYRKIRQKNKDQYQLVFDNTPFYAESGGQVGDTGYIENANEKIHITDTKKENELIVHFADHLPGSLKGMFTAVVNRQKRELTMDNHSATHLLHAALRTVLGRHVEQKGSLVNEKILRFDFSHFAAMKQEEIDAVEDIVNARIRQNIALDEKRDVPIEEAKKLGAMALFGEKYGDHVRVITFDPQFSVELCGGTHVTSTGHIGLFKILSESSVAAGVRRIEAITASEAERFVRQELKALAQVKSMFKNPRDIVSATQNLVEEKHTLEKKLEAMQLEQANRLKDELAGKVVKSNGYSLILERVSVPSADALKNIAYGLRNQFDDLLLILAADIDNKPQVTVMIGDKLAQTNRYHAGNLVKQLAKEIDGGGGGQPFFATAGGKNIEGLDAVLEKAKQLIQS